MHMVLPNTISRTQYKCSKHLTVIFAWFPKLSCFSEDFPLIGQQRPIFYCLIGRLMFFFFSICSTYTKKKVHIMYCRSKYSYVLPKQVRRKYVHANHQPLLALISSSTPTPHIHGIVSMCIYISCSHKWNHLETFQPFKHSNLWPKTQSILTTA